MVGLTAIEDPVTAPIAGAKDKLVAPVIVHESVTLCPGVIDDDEAVNAVMTGAVAAELGVTTGTTGAELVGELQPESDAVIAATAKRQLRGLETLILAA